ncbi:sensor histidine kinase [Acidicapsa dinghuensis]|uniref:histidine kinase n=1 Tax=Acidicapsa dinghuensis TaxID=2218256 RepID=A0ABW1EGB6_9BACT|nr:ATP-binding protein [Acidicapsa dinghuensis]
MKSLQWRIVLIFTFALLCSSFAMWKISDRISHEATGDFFRGSVDLELEQATRMYEEGGSHALGVYLSETNAALPGVRYLTDASGRDLVSGVDRSNMLSLEKGPPGPPPKVNGQFVFVKSSADRRYHLILFAPPPIKMARFIPYFVSVALAIILLGWILSIGIVSPLHRLAGAVDRFGRGDLSARVAMTRRDEIGDVGRSFNSMADRIETLLTAERRLLQDVSHELRSPLARLSFAAELMGSAADPDAALDRMRREIMRLSQLIATLLEVTSIEGDPSSRETQSFSVTPLVEEVVSDCAFEAESRGVRIESSLNSIARLEGNPELVRRAIENVLRNSIRYSGNGAAVQVNASDAGGSTTITVSDSGPGVPEEMLSRIFDPFFRVEASRETTSGGVGLGLSIARRSVLLHHGQIAARNLSPGLQVTISLPISPGPISPG